MARNALQAGKDGRLSAEPTGETEDIDAGLVMRAIGYRGIALPGVPFDERSATIPNEGGRVVASTGRCRRPEAAPPECSPASTPSAGSSAGPRA